jgi:2-(3-amino-3-carboxypropyl)histidine synthase
MYNLELEKAVEEIRKEHANIVVVQLPDGLKPKAKEIKEHLEKNTGAEIFLWGGSCFGACDTPNLNSIKADLLIQFGHSEWRQ